MTDPTPDPSALLPPPDRLRPLLAKAMRDVEVLSGLLRLSERVTRRDGRPVSPTPAQPAAVPTTGRTKG